MCETGKVWYVLMPRIWERDGLRPILQRRAADEAAGPLKKPFPIGSKENLLLCRGGSSSLTFPGVLRGFAMDAKGK